MQELPNTYVVFTDMAGSTQANRLTREKHLEVARDALQENKEWLRPVEGILIRVTGDELKAEFIDAKNAIQAILNLRSKTKPLNDGLNERIGIDSGPAQSSNTDVTEVGSDYYRTVARTQRIMDLCPACHILCSQAFIDDLSQQQWEELGVFGPYFVKLRGFEWPVSVYFLGQQPSMDDFITWQTKAIPNARNTMALFSANRISEVFAILLAAPLYVLFRNRGTPRGLGRILHVTGQFAFSGLYRFGKLNRRLEWFALHGAIGAGDESMLLGDNAKSIEWVTRIRQMVVHIHDAFYRTFADYQIGHCLAHNSPDEEAERFLNKAYAGAEKLGNAWLAGWAAIYLGRCLRGRNKLEDSEGWLLSSLIILSYSNDATRQSAYALVQLARLRATQGRYAEVQWYLDRAKLLFEKALSAADDTRWEEKNGLLLQAIQKKAAHIPIAEQLAAVDPARQLVTTVLHPLFVLKKGALNDRH